MSRVCEPPAVYCNVVRHVVRSASQTRFEALFDPQRGGRHALHRSWWSLWAAQPYLLAEPIPGEEAR